MRLRFTHSATCDLQRLHDFIAEQNPRAAARVSQRLGGTIRHLRDHPNLGRPLEELPEVRELVAGDYVVRYTIREAAVVVYPSHTGFRPYRTPCAPRAVLRILAIGQAITRHRALP